LNIKRRSLGSMPLPHTAQVTGLAFLPNMRSSPRSLLALPHEQVATPYAASASVRAPERNLACLFASDPA
jgi:hypothetical protein